MYDLAIIGGGPAGLTAAVYARRAGLGALVLEEAVCGGQIVNSPEVENFPSIRRIAGWEFADNLMKQASELGAEIRYAAVSGIAKRGDTFALLLKGGEVDARTVILANGAKRRKLGCPGEDEFSGKGVSYCATCDGAFFRGKDVAVVGGGSTALEDALFLSNLCAKVYLVHRRTEFRGEKRYVDAVRARSNIETCLPYVPAAVTGGERVSGVTLKNAQTGETRTLDVSAVFAAIGMEPDNARFSELVALDPAGYVIADESCRTSARGIFAAGDTRTKELRQLVTAAADGAAAAVAAADYVNSER